AGEDPNAKPPPIDPNLPDAETIKAALGYQLTMDENSRRNLLREDPSLEIRGCLFEHFLPNRLIATFQKEQAQAQAVLRSLVGDTVARQFGSETLPPEIPPLLEPLDLPLQYKSYLLSKGADGASSGKTLGQIAFTARKFLIFEDARDRVRKELEKIE